MPTAAEAPVADLTVSFWDGLAARVAEAIQYYPLPILTSVLVGAVLGALGCFVVLRRMALIGDALSHAILPGVVVAFIALDRIFASSGGEPDAFWTVWGLFAGALVAGLVTAGLIGWVARRTRAKEDAVTGIIFTAMFGLGVILISLQPKGTHFDLTCFLFGLPLAITKQDFYSIAIVAPAVLLFLTIGYRGLKMLSFDPQMARAVGVRTDLLHYLFMGVLAATVVAALRTVGVIMSVAMLITPAAAAYQLTNRLSVMLVLSSLFGAVSALAGFLLAFALNIPTGPAMVIVATVLFAGALLFSPEYGVVGGWLKARETRRHVVEEDVLKTLAKFGGALPFEALGDKLTPTPPRAIRAALAVLVRAQLVTEDAGSARLTPTGLERGTMLVRSHRIWETWLASEHITAESLHGEAERFEHLHDMADELSKELGDPKIDPHGVPIPPRRT